MKIFSVSLIIIIAVILGAGCSGKGSSKKDSSAGSDTMSVPDTGFTGIKQFMSGKRLAMESEFKNGVKDGLTKTYYINGNLRGTLWYKNGLREDSAKWYYEDGPLFRSTPYRNDTVDGIQKQYFRDGKLKANIGYSKGFRTPHLEEFTKDGKIVGGYPGLVVKTKDDYKARGVYTVSLSLSDKSTKVRFYRGDFGKGIFDTTQCAKIKTVDGVGTLYLKKTNKPQSGSVDVIAEILTNYGNNLLVHKNIELPYKDLN